MNTEIKSFIAALEATDTLRKTGIAENLGDVWQPYTALTGNLKASDPVLRRAIYAALKAGVLEKASGIGAKNHPVLTYRRANLFFRCDYFLDKWGYVPTESEFALLDIWDKLPLVYSGMEFFSPNEISARAEITLYSAAKAAKNLTKAGFLTSPNKHRKTYRPTERGLEFRSDIEAAAFVGVIL